MRTFRQKQNQSQKPASSGSGLVRPNSMISGPNQQPHPLLHRQRMLGDQAVQQKNAEEFIAGSTSLPFSHFAHDFSWIPVYPKAGAQIQPAFTPTRKGVLQRKCACDGTPGATGECAQCQRKRVPSYRRVLPLPLPLDVRDGLRTPALGVIISKLGPGEPLSPADRAPLESLLPLPLDRVRVHSDSQSRITADLLNSEAFTYGDHIVLGNAAETAQGRRKWLLAHEVAHTVQQHPQAIATETLNRDVRRQPELEADQFANVATADKSGFSPEYPPLHATSTGLARKVIWKQIHELPNDLLLIVDVDDGDFVGGCVKAIVPHAGVKLIKKHPHTELFNLHVGFITNAAGEFCIFFYESVTKICEMKCFPSKEALQEAWDQVVEWIKEMLIKVFQALAIAALIIVAVVLAYLIAQAIAAALAAALLVLA